MADNVPITPGTGRDIATDQIGGVDHQRVKIQHGAEGSATDVSSASPLPVADSAVAGFVDGLEALLTTLGGYLDNVEALLGSGKTLQFAEIDRATSGAVVAAAGASTKIYVVSYSLVCSTANTVEWRSASTGISGAMSFAANGGIAERGSLVEPLMRTAGNEALNIQLGSAQQVSGRISYYTGP